MCASDPLKAAFRALVNDKDRVIKELESRVSTLEGAIRKHRDERGDDRCWLDDAKLYRLIGDRDDYDTSLPPKCEFLESCSRFWEKRQRPADAMMDRTAESRYMTIRELTDRVVELEAQLAAAEANAPTYAELRRDHLEELAWERAARPTTGFPPEAAHEE